VYSRDIMEMFGNSIEMFIEFLKETPFDVLVSTLLQEIYAFLMRFLGILWC
jgi:hypothetical protein